jgi:hypothetical protein
MTRPVFTSALSTSTILLLFAAACVGLRPPAQNAGPGISQEGVQIAVTAQVCTQTSEPGYSSDLVDTTLEVQVRNPTTYPIAVHRDAFRLVTPVGVALQTVTWRAVTPLTFKGGETGTFKLRFMTRGGLECAREMDLEPDSGITQADKPLRIAGVHFVPSRPI